MRDSKVKDFSETMSGNFRDFPHLSDIDLEIWGKIGSLNGDNMKGRSTIGSYLIQGGQVMDTIS